MYWSRRDFLLGSLCAPLIHCHLQGQAEYPGVGYRRYHRCLHDYLQDLAQEAYARRNERIAHLTDAESIRGYQDWVRKTFWELVGGKPASTPLNAEVLGSFERPGYRVEKVLYESQPGLHIPGNLYIPTDGEAPFPAVLFQMGHALNGKASATYQRCCQGLVQLGFVVLGFDPMGQGERTYYPDDDGYLTRLSSADEEHTKPGRQMILTGDTSTRMQVWDAIRSLDYLASHPLVDSSRLASTGNSGGGTLTMLLGAVDDRLKAVAISCGNTENHACADFNPPGSTDDAEQNLLYGGEVGFDRWDLLYPMVPKPLLFLTSARDFFGTYSPRYISSGWEEYQKLAKLYKLLERPNHVQWIDTPLPHTASYSFRLEIYRWLVRWLQDDQRMVQEEPPTRVEEDKTLWVSDSGNLVRSFGGETPFTLNRSAAAKIRTPERLPDLAQFLRVGQVNSAARFRSMGTRPSMEGIEIEAVEVQSAAKVWVPAWLFRHRERGSEAGRILLILEPSGRGAHWSEGDLCQELASRGTYVCAADIRWIGDLRPEYSPGARSHAAWHQDEQQWSWGSLMLGRPMLGQRVTDLLALVSALRNRPELQGMQVSVAARGQLTVPVLFLAALEQSVRSLYLAGGLISFRSIIETLDYEHPFANFVPRLLHETDLPQLAASLADRKLILAGTVDGSGRTLPVSDVEKIYGNVQNLVILPKADWNLETLSSVV